MADSATSQLKKPRTFGDLLVWQASMDLAVEVHQLRSVLPQHEKFDLARDLQRTARSIPSNIAEGFCRHSRAAYRSHIAIALGSQGELETQLLLSTRLGYVSHQRCESLLERVAMVGRLLHGLHRALAGR